MPAELEADYYLNNFDQLTDFVYRRYYPLLTRPERHFHEKLQSCSRSARALYVRMLNRKGMYFRQDKLNYSEIDDLEAAVKELKSERLISTDLKKVPLDYLFALFNKKEWGAILATSHFQEVSMKSLSRAELDALLQDQIGVKDLLRMVTAYLEQPVLTLLQSEHFDTYKLCFFGNLHQDMTEYVLRDLGLTRYESYEIDDDNLPFRNARQIRQHRDYYACLDRFEESRSELMKNSGLLLDWLDTLPDPQEFDWRLRSRIRRQRFNVARQLERLGALDQSAELYRHTPLSGSRERRARIEVTRSQPDQALAICHEIRQQPLCEQEAHFASGFGHRTAKKYCPDAFADWPASRPYRPPLQDLQIDLSEFDEASQSCSVELLAEAELESRGACFYVENTLFNGLLGLLIWDLVFKEALGVFYNPFQYAPIDFYLPEFRERTKKHFTERVCELSNGKARTRILENWEQKQGIANPLVSWQNLSIELIELALARIPARHFQVVFERIMDDVRNHRSGLPDLVLFPQTGGYELLEVKGPGDSLQENQRLWMRFFAKHDIPHAVLNVSYV